MKAFSRKIRSLASGARIVRDERGLSTVEYVIILVVIAVLAIGAWKNFGTKIQGQINSSAGEVEHLDQQNTSDSSNGS
jgi:Flp pilus assembly pilin Flp